LKTNNPTSLVSNDNAFQVAWIVYLNGLEVPVASAVVTYGVWAIPECEITLVPDPVMKRFGADDRVTAQVFYCDYWQNPGNPEFRLMFDGEVVGWSYVNTQGGRAITLHCVDYMQIFTQLFFFFMSSIDDFAAGTSGEAVGTGIGTIKTAGMGALYPLSLFTQGLTQPTANPDNTTPITRPIDFVYNVVRALIKKGQPNKTTPGVNFFSPWIYRTKFHRRFIALPYLEEPAAVDADGHIRPGVFPILRAVRADYGLSAVARLAQEIGTTGSVWDMLRQIFSVLMMEFCMLPTAPAIRSDYRTIEIGGPPNQSFVKTAETFNGIANYIVKPQFLFGLPPACNVFFPSQIQQLAYEENYVTQPTRMYFNDTSMTSFLQADVTPGMGKLIQDALAVAHPEEINQAVRASAENPGLNAKNLLVYPDEFFRGPVVDRRVLPRWFTFLQQAQSDKDDSDTEQDNTTARAVPAGDPARDVFRLYANYEFHKEKYARRNGSVRLAFNPYPVPGFPCAAFDRRTTQVDVLGYLMRVVQSLSTAGWSTQVSFSYGRTIQEMFRLLEKQTNIEMDILLQKYDSINAKVLAQEKNLDNLLLPGAVGIAPIEPLPEVRDVIQNFDEAENFYRSLFYREKSIPTYSYEKIQRENETRQRNQETKREGSLGFLQTSVARTTSDDAQVAEDLPGEKKASFYYPDIIQLENSEGDTEGVTIEGIDGAARLKYTEIIEKARNGTASAEEMDELNFVLETPVLQADPFNSQTTELNEAEIFIRTLPPRTNLKEDATIHPTNAAQKLFESYYAAMQYGARPICTLDEYVDFLGESGVREMEVNPDTALATKSARTFPAKYYIRIRRYRPGPPGGSPPANITNTAFTTSADGMSRNTSAAEGSTSTVAQNTQALPEDFPETAKDWDKILIQYRENVLIKQAPKD